MARHHTTLTHPTVEQDIEAAEVFSVLPTTAVNDHPWRKPDIGVPMSAGRYTSLCPHPEKINIYKRGRRWFAVFQGQTATAPQRVQFDEIAGVVDLGKFDAYETLIDAFPEFHGTPYTMVRYVAA